MVLKVLYLVVLISLVDLIHVSFTFELANTAIDQSLYEEALDEELCAAQMELLRNTPLLAMSFADAGIRVPKGVLIGNTLDMGSYHQCINLNQPLPEFELQGKYCVITVPLNQSFELPTLPGLPQFSEKNSYDTFVQHMDSETVKNLREYYIMMKALKGYTGVLDNDRMVPDNPLLGLQLTVAACIPKPCTTRQAFDSYLFNVSALGFEYSDVYCRLPNDKPRTTGDIVAIAVFSLLGLITLVSTSYDLWHTIYKKTDPKQVSVLGKSFSVYTNGRRLMTFSSGADTIECLDGIRALAMAWVLLGHTFTSDISWSNPGDTFIWMTSWESLWVLAAHYTVDTFFFLSGFLVVYTTVGKLNGITLLKNLHLFYLNRLLRMFPLLAAGVLLEATFLNHATDGPNWTTVSNLVNTCRTTWWSTLLHVQNYVNPGETCIGQSWYLAIDTQLHILSPIILVWVLWGKKKIAWMALAVGLIGTLIASTVYIFINKFPPIMTGGGPGSFQNYLHYYYVNTLTRASPFVVGMIFGYAVRVFRRKLTGIYAIIYWAAFFGLMTYLIYFNLPINRPTWDNQSMSNFYNSFFRAFWAIAVGCLVYACVNGFAGPINWFLSLQVWKIHSRVSYGMYLFHYMLMVSVNYTAIAPVYFSPGLMVFKFLAHYSYSFAVSFFLTLVLDAPCSTLFKLILGAGAKKPVKKVDSEIIEPTKEVEKQVQ